MVSCPKKSFLKSSTPYQAISMCIQTVGFIVPWRIIVYPNIRPLRCRPRAITYLGPGEPTRQTISHSNRNVGRRDCTGLRQTYMHSRPNKIPLNWLVCFSHCGCVLSRLCRLCYFSRSPLSVFLLSSRVCLCCYWNCHISRLWCQFGEAGQT